MELVIKDEQVQKALDATKAKLKAWGAAVDRAGRESFQAVNDSAQSMVPQTVATVGVLGASMAAVRASAIAVGIAGRTAFTLMTTSVLRAATVMGALSLTASRFLKGTKAADWLDKIFSNSALAEKAGRWTRFLGLLSGSSVIRDIGNRMERFGLGTAIVQGFRTGGFVGGIGASIGAAIRSSKSVIIGAMGSVLGSVGRGLSAPFGMALGLFRRSPAGEGAAGGGIASTASGANAVAGAFGRATTSVREFVTVSGALKAVGNNITSIALKVGGLAAIISGPALIAAKNLVSNAKEMGKKGLIPESWVTQAQNVSDAMQEAKDAVSVAWAQIGVLALPIIKSMAENTAKLADTLGGFIQENRELAQQVIVTAAKIAGIAAGFAVFGKAVAVVAPLLPMIVSPIGLIVAGVGALVYLFPQIRSVAVQVFNFFRDQFGFLVPIVSQTIQGISNAISGGSISAASRVLWAGVNLIWLEGVNKLRETYQDVVTSIAGFGINMFAGLKTAWVVSMQFMGDAWDVLMGGFVTAWNVVQNAMARGIARLIAWWEGLDVEEVLKALSEAQKYDNSKGKADREKRIIDRDAQAKKDLDEIEKRRKEQLEANKDISQERKKQANEELEKARKEFDAAQAHASEIATRRAKFPGLSSDEKFGSSQLGTFSTAALGRQQYGDSALVVLRSIDKGIKDLNTAVGKGGVGLRFTFQKFK